MPSTIRGGVREILYTIIQKFKEKQEERKALLMQKINCLVTVTKFIENLDVHVDKSVLENVKQLKEVEETELACQTQTKYLEEVSSMTDISVSSLKRISNEGKLNNGVFVEEAMAEISVILVNGCCQWGPVCSRLQEPVFQRDPGAEQGRQTLTFELKVPAMMAPSVLQRTKSPRSPRSPPVVPRKLQNGSGSSQEPADSSPGNSISDVENFECYGEADADVSSNTLENGSRSPGNLNRHSWTRTSLRRTQPSHQENLPHRRWGSMRHSGKRQLGSNVLASQLYRSSSFNSSGCGSGGEPADDMYSDVSLEEDVQGLNYKVQLLQQQVTSLADTQSSADDRYSRAKADNAVLQARVHMLDEQIREIECRCEERIAEEQKRCREAIARVERDRDAQLAAFGDRLAAAEAEASDLKQEVGRLRGVAETLRANAEIAQRGHREAQEQVGELVAQLSAAREAERKERESAAAATGLLAAAKLELQSMRETPPPPPDPRLDELRQELMLLRTQNKSLSEAQEELQAQILTRGVEEGRSLLDGVSGPLVANSLAHELSQMSDDQLDDTQTDHSIELEKLQKALKEQQDVNFQLRNYIDGILLSIVENYPQLLEVKCAKPIDMKS